MSPIDRLFDILRRVGQRHYGESDVTQYEHAVQCAELAERSGAPPALIAAALLHDLGHLTNAEDRAATARGEDAEHERMGAALLRPWFGDAVAEPIRLHVSAKRYLVSSEPAYLAHLSPASRRSLALQGGALDAAEAERFIATPHARGAVLLRRWDDDAKVKGAAVPALEHFRPALEACLLTAPEAGAQFFADDLDVHPRRSARK